MRTRGHDPASSATMKRSPAHCRAATVGTGDTKMQGTCARLARSSATSRACHVGARSSCRVSSCSSSTMSAARCGTLAHTAERAPTTTSTPDAAAAQSSGSTAVVRPARRHSAAKRRARTTVGVTTISGPCVAAASTTSTPDESGPTCTTPPRAIRSVVGAARLGEYRGTCSLATLVLGEAETKNGRRRDAQRWLAHSISCTTSADGPTDETFRIGKSRSRSTPASCGSTRAITQPGTSRPCNATRTRVPTSIRGASTSGTR